MSHMDVEKLLGQLSDRLPAAPDGIEANVWSAVHGQSAATPAARSRNRRRSWLALGIAAVVVTVTSLLSRKRGPPAILRLGPSLYTTVVASSSRGAGRETTRVVGDRLRVRARTLRPRYLELRVYYGGTAMVARCSSERPGPCEVASGAEGSELSVELELTRVGQYRALWIAADTPIDLPYSSLDEDAAEAVRTGADVVVGERVDIW